MDSSVFGIILAAGRATRFGDLKQLQPVHSKPMVVRAIAAAAAACNDRILLVTGYEAGQVARACAGQPGFIAVNDNHDAGIGSSIATATRRLQHVAGALLITLADQPFVTGEHLCALIDAWDGVDKRIVASRYAGIGGPPVLFDRGCFPDLASLDGDQGARHLFEDARYEVVTVDFEPAATDIDTPEDLRRISRNVRS